MLVFIFILLAFFVKPIPATAQIPLLHQLFFAYIPDPYVGLEEDNILGVSTTLPDITSANAKVITIALLGDSMIDTLGPKAASVEAALAKYYPGRKFKILNYGVGSSTIESGLKRLTEGYDYKDQHFPSLISNQPDIVIVESFAYNNFGNTQDGVNKHWLNLGAITTTIKQELPSAKIVIATTIAPNSIIFANNVAGLSLSALDKIERASTIKLYLQNTINFANSQKFPLADAYHPSLNGNDGNRTYINPADNIHPSPAGAVFFGNILAKAIFDNNLVN